MEPINIEGNYYHFQTVPDECPICHHHIEPRPLVSNVMVFNKKRPYWVQMVFRCPREKCQSAFLAIYRQKLSPQATHYIEQLELTGTAPNAPAEPAVPEQVKEVSPDYVLILGQAAAAEAYGLDQVAGAGYRKALEFLVKDYIIRQHTEKADTIRKAFLGRCIEENLEDARIKECAKRAAWLGNDETHYERKWEEKDIKDLKLLIKLTEAWILNDELTRQYLRDMPPP